VTPRWARCCFAKKQKVQLLYNTAASQSRERAGRRRRSVDVDGGGTLDPRELRRCFRLMDCVVSKEVIMMLIAEVSNDGDDEVDMEEWTRMVQNVYKGSIDMQGIGDMKALEELDISRNKLTRLPYGMGFMTSLRSLVLDEPHMVVVPCDDILRTARDDATILTRYMRLLHDASLSDTLELTGFILSYVPNEVIELTNLTELSMSGLSLKVVVSEIAQIPVGPRRPQPARRAPRACGMCAPAAPSAAR